MCDCDKKPSISVQVDNANITIAPSLVVDSAIEAISRPLGAMKKFFSEIQEVAR